MRCPTIELGLAAVLMAAGAAAEAQQPVYTYPVPGTTQGSNASGTIASTGTFQQVFAAAGLSPGAFGPRKGCQIINQGSTSMWVSEGKVVASSSTASSVKLAVGAAFHCADSGVVLSGQVNISGSAGEAFYAAQE